MARIRSIKPELPLDEKLGRCSRDARLLFILLWTIADDHGRFRASPELLRGQLFPYDADVDDDMVAKWFKELEDSGRVQSYEERSQRYGAVTNWAKHQRVDNAGRSFFPAPPFAEAHGDSPQPAEGFGDPPSELEPSQSDDEFHMNEESPSLAATRGGSPLDHWDHWDHNDHRRSSVSESPSEREQDMAAEGVVVADESMKERRAAAVDFLARNDLQRAKDSGQQFTSDAGMLRKLRKDRDDVDGPAIDALMAEHPGWLPRRLAEAVAAPPPVTPPAYYEAEGTGQGVPMPDGPLKARVLARRAALAQAAPEAEDDPGATEDAPRRLGSDLGGSGATSTGDSP